MCIRCAGNPFTESIRSVGAAVYGGYIMCLHTFIWVLCVTLLGLCAHNYGGVSWVCVLCWHMHTFMGEGITLACIDLYTPVCTSKDVYVWV